jgi:outer membrane protein TolC
MPRHRRTQWRWSQAFLFGLAVGCTTLRPTERVSQRLPVVQAPRSAADAPSEEGGAVQQAAYQAEDTATPDATSPALPIRPPDSKAADSADAPFAGVAELAVGPLVQAVLTRNPTLAQMVAAYEAAQARYPQVTSLDDPTFTTTLAPAGIGTIQNRNRGYRLDISQRLPWCGKLALRGENAKAQARAAANDLDDTRLQLVESAKAAFYDYYQAYRALEVNAENLRLLREFRRNAEARYRTGQVPQQDVLQADVEVGRQQRRNLTLERMRQVAAARINTFLNLDPDGPLPPPPRKVDVEEELPEAGALRAAALARRPDLQALANRIAADEASLGLAYKDYYPDFQLMTAYDTFWVEQQLQPQVAVQMNLPVRLARRDAAVWEAKTRRRGAAGRVRYVEADAQRLPFPDDTFGLTTVAFGLRNVTDTDRGLAEMVRVTRPGGRSARVSGSRQALRGRGVPSRGPAAVAGPVPVSSGNPADSLGGFAHAGKGRLGAPGQKPRARGSLNAIAATQ